MTDFAHEHVVKFYSLYTSERRQIADWLGVSRESPQESDAQYGRRVLFAARDAGKVHDLVDRIEGFLARRPPERVFDGHELDGNGRPRATR